MNHRERVLKSLQHQEPDRVAIDFGGTSPTGIAPAAYKELKAHLGLEIGVIRVLEPLSQKTLVEDEVQVRLRSDVRGVFFEPKEWRRGVLHDGSAAELPRKWITKTQPDGSEIVIDEAGSITAVRAPGSDSYMPRAYQHPPLSETTSASDLRKWSKKVETYIPPAYLDQDFKELGRKAKCLYDNTDYFLIARFGGWVFTGGWDLRGYENFMIDLVTNQAFAEALMDMLVASHMRTFERYAEAVGRYIQAVEVSDDLGLQDGPCLNPDVYRKIVKPYHKKLYQFIKSKCDAYLFMHSDGAIRPFIPDLIEIGVDILNPVQVSAKGMESAELKRDFGREITFWGGGCDNQSVLPFGTPEDVRDEVRRRIDDLGPGGGFVFAPIQDILPGVPPENIVAMYETAMEFGEYR